MDRLFQMVVLAATGCVLGLTVAYGGRLPVPLWTLLVSVFVAGFVCGVYTILVVGARPRTHRKPVANRPRPTTGQFSPLWQVPRE